MWNLPTEVNHELDHFKRKLKSVFMLRCVHLPVDIFIFVRRPICEQAFEALTELNRALGDYESHHHLYNQTSDGVLLSNSRFI